MLQCYDALTVCVGGLVSGIIALGYCIKLSFDIQKIREEKS